jgi:hypothetical protein
VSDAKPGVGVEAVTAPALHGFADMDATFERKLRAAISAGWRVLLVEVVFLTLVWAAYLTITGVHPTWMLALWGPDVTWSIVATISLQAIAACKVAIWFQVALLAWAWMWSSRLRKLGAESAERRSDNEREQRATVGSKVLSPGS